MKYAPGYDIRLPMVSNNTNHPEINPHSREKPPGAPFEVVGPRSPLNWREAVEMMAICFKREMQFEFIGYSAYTRDLRLMDDRMLVFMDTYLEEKEPTKESPTDYTIRMFFTGVIAMRARKERWNSRPNWTLDWVWFHPFARRRRHLTGAWPFLLQMYPDLKISPPVSDAMKAFLNKTGYAHLTAPNVTSGQPVARAPRIRPHDRPSVTSEW